MIDNKHKLNTNITYILYKINYKLHFDFGFGVSIFDISIYKILCHYNK